MVRLDRMLLVFGVTAWIVLAGWSLLKAPGPSVFAQTRPVQTQGSPGDALPNSACASCHQSIYDEYRKTPMANASGPAADGFLPASFSHATSGVSYRIESEKGHVYLRFSRPQDVSVRLTSPALADSEGMEGRRELKYFIGSGKRGRTYLFEDQGYWFESPINWYGKKRVWDMAPNYMKAQSMPLALPVDPGCLRCHASGAAPSLPEARNKYAAEPFAQGGITCTACHGDASAHLASGGKVAMAKIGAMDPPRRDSICLSCHLEGQDAVVHQGKRLVDFRPGESIFDYASFFVQRQDAGARATSQWEALLKSGCKRAAGDKLTCTTCHDPHSSTAAMSDENRVAFYRAKCLACHDPAAIPIAGSGQPPPTTGFAAKHHPESRDCAGCHMPRANSSDIAHEQVTDHRIPRIVDPNMARGSRKAPESPSSDVVLVSVASTLVEQPSGKNPRQVQLRDLGLAYAMEAAKGNRPAGEHAIQLLTEAESLPGADLDHELHAQLGFLKQLAGMKEAAEGEYAKALAADRFDSFAAGNLALLKAGDHQYSQALALWDHAFQEDPVQLKAGLNLAIVECGLGKKESALGTLDRILEFSPDDGKAREMARDIRAGRKTCPDR